MRIRSRSDNNQASIVKDFRSMGCSVVDLHSLGRGVPDLLVGFRGFNLLVEVKSEKGILTKDQIDWQKIWKGDLVFVVRKTDDVIRLINLIIATNIN